MVDFVSGMKHSSLKRMRERRERFIFCAPAQLFRPLLLLTGIPSIFGFAITFLSAKQKYKSEKEVMESVMKGIVGIELSGDGRGEEERERQREREKDRERTARLPPSVENWISFSIEKVERERERISFSRLFD